MKEAHILLDDSIGAKYALLPGDPARLDHIKKYLQDTKEIAFNREYRSVVGFYKGIKVLAISTGIGSPSAAIALEELENIGIKTVIRIGSCGALQSSIEIGDLVIAEAAIRHEGTSKNYVESIFPAVSDYSVLTAIKKANKKLDYPNHSGIVLTHDSFYTQDHHELEAYWSNHGALGSDLETSTILTLSRIKNIKAASILNNVVIYGDDTSESISSYTDGEDLALKGEEREIILALETIYELETSQ